jgi:hypothetical protein
VTDAFLMEADCVHGNVWYECKQCPQPIPCYGPADWKWDEQNGWFNVDDDPATPTEAALLDEIERWKAAYIVAVKSYYELKFAMEDGDD